MSTASQRMRNAPDVVTIARRSLVAVRGVSSSGTGWVALGNGLVMTSHEAVGYDASVVLELESGRRAEGRVVWVDVARDLALVLPAETLPLPPLLPRPDLPRLGEPVLALSALPDQPWRVVSAIVSAIDHRIGPLRCFELDTAVTSCGGPVIDLDGRLIGVGGLDLPRGTRRRALPAGQDGAVRPPTGSLSIPITALSKALAAVDVAADQFEGHTPTYRCPSCNEPFQAADDRCLGCGRALPHTWDVGDAARAATAGAERLAQEVVADLGPGTTAARIGPRAFRLSSPGEGGVVTHVTLEIDEEGTCIRGKIPLLRVPVVNQEPFYRFLLTLNDQAVGSQRFFVEGDTVFLSFNEPTCLLRPGEGATRLLQELVREGDRYRKALGEPFDAAQMG